MIDLQIKRLVDYGVNKGLIEEADRIWATNEILDALHLSEYMEPDCKADSEDLEEILKGLLDYAAQQGILEHDSTVYRDLFDTRLMGLLTPRPHEVIDRFSALYRQSPQAATDFFYQFSQDTDYIRAYRVKKDIRWKAQTEYGDLDITINLSKPEKDPRAIAAARSMAQSGYPKCLLCPQNEGYAGRVNHPARQNHRIIPITLDGKPWFFQYSPYVYYNEHCIVLNAEHTPMKIDAGTFRRLLGFVKQFPHYFLGSNADLPIVGGSILTHDHFQGGHYKFAMESAPIETPFLFSGYEELEAGIVKWPMSVLRLRGTDEARLVELADRILQSWRAYTDEQAFVFAETEGTPHNTITPIARMSGGKLELDLVLRNNITTDEHPLGVYHPHAELHHIKKENIGLIEVMGLAVLPARLKEELALLEEAILMEKDIRADERISSHADWVDEILARHDTLEKEAVGDLLREEVGKVFGRVLEDAGVFKRTDAGKAAFLLFLESVNK